jgi:hypothetical protein
MLIDHIQAFSSLNISIEAWHKSAPPIAMLNLQVDSPLLNQWPGQFVCTFSGCSRLLQVWQPEKIVECWSIVPRGKMVLQVKYYRFGFDCRALLKVLSEARMFGFAEAQVFDSSLSCDCPASISRCRYLLFSIRNNRNWAFSVQLCQKAHSVPWIWNVGAHIAKPLLSHKPGWYYFTKSCLCQSWRCSHPSRSFPTRVNFNGNFKSVLYQFSVHSTNWAY